MSWVSLHASVCGRKHYRKGIPCQDAALAKSSPRAYALACDGRGSAERSHLGAEAAIQALQSYLAANEYLLAQFLDQTNTAEADVLEAVLTDGCYRAAAYAQKDCAQRYGGSPRDYEFTLLLLVLGKHFAYYLHVGDGAILVEDAGEMKLLSQPQNGEFANQTYFVRFAHSVPMQKGTIPVADLSGVGLFSDGTAEGMIESGSGRPTPAFAQIWEQMRQDEFGRAELLDFLTRSDWEPRVQDDRCLALLSRVDVELPMEDAGDLRDGPAEAAPMPPTKPSKRTSVAFLPVENTSASPKEFVVRFRIHPLKLSSDLPLWLAITLLLINLTLQISSLQ